MKTKTTGRKATPKTGSRSAARPTAPLVRTKKSTTAAVESAAPVPTRGRRPAKIDSQTAQASAPSQVGTSKQARLIALLGSAAGGSIAQLTALTGWQAHTVRGTISGVLRKRLGLNVACAAGSTGDRVYRIIAAPAA